MSVSDARPSPITTAHWLAIMSAWRRWFSYSVEGMEHLRTHECKIVVGYHGRPLAWDLFLLGAEIQREQGYLPLALVHYDFLRWPYLRWLTEGLVWTTGKGPILDDAIAKGRHVILAPGGVSEGLRPGWVRYRVEWPAYGYLRLAIARGLEVVPVAAAGVDDTYFGLNDNNRLKQRLGLDNGSAALWAGLGPLGLYPWSPPFPARIHQIVGAPVVPVIPEHERAELLGDPEAMQALHERCQSRVQELLERACEAIQSGPKSGPKSGSQSGSQLEPRAPLRIDSGPRRAAKLRAWVEGLEQRLPWKHESTTKTPAGR